MLLSAYLPKILTALFGGIFVIAGIATFGNSALFDRIFFGILIFTAIICKKDINVLGVVVIIAFHQLAAEFSWFIFQNETPSNSLVISAIFYFVGIYTFYRLRYDLIAKLLLVSLIISLGSEIYWFVQDKNRAAMHWYIIVLAINLLTRHLIFLRVNYTEGRYPQKAKSINLDWHIYKLNAVAIFLQSINILEYSLRRVFDLSDLVYVYNVYPYLMQAISTYTIFIIFHESYKLILPKLLRA